MNIRKQWLNLWLNCQMTAGYNKIAAFLDITPVFWFFKVLAADQCYVCMVVIDPLKRNQ